MQSRLLLGVVYYRTTKHCVASLLHASLPHNIQERAVVRDGQVVARPMMYLALSYDHRLIDGREAVQFLVRIKDCLEAPERILLEI